MTSRWFSEALYEDVAVRYQVKTSLHREETPFQNMRFLDSKRFGKMLVLDGIVQTTEKDEFIYHEMLSHIPLFAHPRPERVLVIGGGDGGILREALKHKTVKRAVLVEIDKRVIDFSKKHLPSVCGDSFCDKRVETVVDDGAAYVRNTTEKFDVVIVDSSDPIGPATVLFTKKFCRNVRGILTENGVMVRQCGSSFLQPEELRGNMRILRTVFRHNAPFVFAVPTYFGGLFSASFSSQGIEPTKMAEASVEKRFRSLRMKTGYYNPAVHVAAFKVPEYVKELAKWQKK